MADLNPSGYPAADAPLNCLRCKTETHFVGTQHFHEGTRAFDFLGGLFELLKGRESFDVYVCPRCGHVEFFAEAIGKELRGQEPPEREWTADTEREASDESRQEWRCPSCNETVPGGFEVCWNCQAKRHPDDHAPA